MMMVTAKSRENCWPDSSQADSHRHRSQVEFQFSDNLKPQKEVVPEEDGCSYSANGRYDKRKKKFGVKKVHKQP